MPLIAIALLALFPAPASGVPTLATFSAGIAESKLNATEQTLLDYAAVGGGGGCLTYFWITGGPPVAQAVIRMFVDGEAPLHSAPLHLPADRPQRSLVVWGRADGSALPALPARAGGGLPYLPPRSSAGSHLHAASRSARTTTDTTSPGNSWRRS